MHLSKLSKREGERREPRQMWGIDFDLEMNLHVIKCLEKRQECFWVLMGGDTMDFFVQFQF